MWDRRKFWDLLIQLVAFIFIHKHIILAAGALIKKLYNWTVFSPFLYGQKMLSKLVFSTAFLQQCKIEKKLSFWDNNHLLYNCNSFIWKWKELFHYKSISFLSGSFVLVSWWKKNIFLRTALIKFKNKVHPWYLFYWKD